MSKYFSHALLPIAKRFLDEDDEDHDEDHHDEDHDHDDHADEHDEHHDEVDVDAFKIGIMFAMFFCIGFGLLPKVCKACRENKEALSMMNCFSAGLFLGMALIHMMPEAEEIYHGWVVEQELERAFPLPYVVFFLGYVLILALDQVIAKKYMAKNPQLLGAN